MKGTTVEVVASSWIEVLGGLSAKYMRSVPPLFCAIAGPAAAAMSRLAAPRRIVEDHIVLSSQTLAASMAWLGKNVDSRSHALPERGPRGPRSGRLPAIDARAAVHRQGHAGDEIGLVRRQEQRSIGDVPAGAHLAAQRHLGIALGL